MICQRKADRYRSGHPTPTEILLAVEVADTTVEKDRFPKAAKYAEAGIPEYWIINLRDQQLEVHQDPDQTSGVYGSIQRYQTGSQFSSAMVGTATTSDFLV